MPDAEQAISFQRRASGYTADARFTSPDHAVLPAAEVLLALDLAARSVLHDDPTAYGRLLSAQRFADARLRNAWQQARAMPGSGTCHARVRQIPVAWRGCSHILGRSIGHARAG